MEQWQIRIISHRVGFFGSTIVDSKLAANLIGIDQCYTSGGSSYMCTVCKATSSDLCGAEGCMECSSMMREIAEEDWRARPRGQGSARCEAHRQSMRQCPVVFLAC